MYFQVLSHAGLRVVAGGKELICDPWLVGSTYWRSWWNYPPVPQSLVDELCPDYIYLTHLHWDHFQKASLKRFHPDTPVLVPYDRYDRMVRDLATIGMKNVRELKHGEHAELAPGFCVQSFHFSPFVTDSALVIKADDVVLLNANDAKFAGGPLRQILKAYPNVDFCFRSHSSANPRACYHSLDGGDSEVEDDNEHYLRAFALFIAAVKPRYAIPFASNSCLLHDDVYAMNQLIQTPHAVRDFFEQFAAEHGLDNKLQIMVPGDKWDSDEGFALGKEDWFTNRETKLEAYRQRVSPALRRQAELESKVNLQLGTVARFFAKAARDVPFVLTAKLRGREILLVAKSGDQQRGFAVNLADGGRVREIAPEQFDQFDARIHFPAIILRQALKMNMFEHASISKRVNFYATSDAMPALKRFVRILELIEAEVFPFRRHFNRRAIKAVLPRWREGILYSRAGIDLLRGRALPDLEEQYLKELS